MDSDSLSHTRWKCEYHIVWIPKYRRKVLFGRVRADLREILRTLCQYKHIEIVAGSVMPDHIHLVVAIPPKMAVSDVVGYLKGKSALQIFEKHLELSTRFDRTMWARGYYVTTIADVSEETIKRYVEEQYEESRKEEDRGRR